jgi:hypothetical protein
VEPFGGGQANEVFETVRLLDQRKKLLGRARRQREARRIDFHSSCRFICSTA